MAEPLNAAVVDEGRQDLDRLALVWERPDRTIGRWADDEPDVENIPLDLTFSSSIPGGDADLSAGLLRDLAYRAPDLRNLNRIYVQGPGASTEWRGYLTRTPQRRDQVTPAAVGDVGRLRGDPSLRMIGVDRDPSNWTGPSNARRLALINSNQPHKQDAEVVPGENGQALRLSISDGWVSPFKPVCEAWYNAGQGLAVGRVYGKFGGGLGETWNLYVRVAADDAAASQSVSADLYAGVAGAFDIVPSGDWQYAALLLQFSSTPAGNEGQEFPLSISELAVYGKDVPQAANPAGGPPGVLGAEVLKAVLTKAGNGIGFDDNSFSAGDFVIPHLVWLDAVTAEQAILDTNRFYRNLWGVYGGNLRWKPPEDFGRLWHVRRDEGADPQLNGPDSEQEYNGVLVRYDDALTGTRRLVGPAQSGYAGPSGLSRAGLEDADPYLPLNEWGEKRWAVLDAGLTSEAGAIRLGELFLEGTRARLTSGSIEIGAWQVYDATDARYPAWAPKAGDRLIVDDEPNAAERLIVEASYTHTSRTASLTLDSPPNAIEALQERLQVVLVGVVD